MNEKFINDTRFREIDYFVCSRNDDCKACPVYHLCDVDDDSRLSWDKDEETLEAAYRLCIDFGEIVGDEQENNKEDNEEEDVVNHPNHYKANAMECIDEMVLVFGKQAVINFCKCNAWKYRYRSEHKNGDEDLKKADWYIAKIKELEGSE